MEDKYPYKVYRDGELILEAAEACRYSGKIELSLLEAGYTIKFRGKKLTKTEIRKAVRSCG